MCVQMWCKEVPVNQWESVVSLKHYVDPLFCLSCLSSSLPSLSSLDWNSLRFIFFCHDYTSLHRQSVILISFVILLQLWKNRKGRDDDSRKVHLSKEWRSPLEFRFTIVLENGLRNERWRKRQSVMIAAFPFYFNSLKVKELLLSLVL